LSGIVWTGFVVRADEGVIEIENFLASANEKMFLRVVFKPLLSQFACNRFASRLPAFKLQVAQIKMREKNAIGL
jgi:hypothetical protein